MWDWRTVLIGYGDKMLYNLGDLAGDLPFAELKRRALINPVAQAADKAPDFSQRIREGRPGFEVNRREAVGAPLHYQKHLQTS